MWTRVKMPPLEGYWRLSERLRIMLRDLIIVISTEVCVHKKNTSQRKKSRNEGFLPFWTKGAVEQTEESDERDRSSISGFTIPGHHSV